MLISFFNYEQGIGESPFISKMSSCQKRQKQNTYDNYIVNYLYNRLSKSFQLPLEFSIQKEQKKVKWTLFWIFESADSAAFYKILKKVFLNKFISFSMGLCIDHAANFMFLGQTE